MAQETHTRRRVRQIPQHTRPATRSLTTRRRCRPTRSPARCTAPTMPISSGSSIATAPSGSCGCSPRTSRGGTPRWRRCGDRPRRGSAPCAGSFSSAACRASSSRRGCARSKPTGRQKWRGRGVGGMGRLSFRSWSATPWPRRLEETGVEVEVEVEMEMRMLRMETKTAPFARPVGRLAVMWHGAACAPGGTICGKRRRAAGRAASGATATTQRGTRLL